MMKMKKRYKHNIAYLIHDEPIFAIIEALQQEEREMKKEGYEEIFLSLEIDDEDGYNKCECFMVGYRMETDDEAKERENEATKRYLQKIHKDKSERKKIYEKLKKEFEV